MSANVYQAEPMEVDDEEVLFVLSLKWINPKEPQKVKRLKTSLEKMLQTWFNKCKHKVDCSVEMTLKDGRVVVKTKPAPALADLQKLNNQTLTGRDGQSVTITSISLTRSSPQFDTQVPEDALMNLSASLQELQTEQVQKREQSNAPREEVHSCSVPVDDFWYVNHMYEEEMKRIEKVTEVKIMADVKVRFEVDQKHGRPDNALDEFANLVQKSLAESSGSVIPLKFRDPDQWSKVLKTIQKKESKLLVTLTSDVMTVRGPKQSQDVISKRLYGDTMQTTNTHGSLAQFFDQVQLGKQSSTVSAGEEMHTCSVPVGLFWYVNHMYEEELKRIEKKNGVKIMANVKVRFEVDGKHGGPDNALDEFANLVQKSLAESCGSVIPLKFIDPDQWSKVLKTIQEKESKLLVTLTSDVMTVRGPKQSQDVISKCLYGDTMQTTNTHGSLAQFFDQVQLGKQSSTVSAGEEMHTCSVPVGLFWYVNHMYEEELKRIEKKNGVKLMADVKVRFEVDQKHGRPDNALDEFANLVQKSLAESSGSVIPLKFRDPDQWSKVLKTIQKKESKLLVTLTSDVMTVRGPKQSQDVISKCLYGDAMQTTNTHGSLAQFFDQVQLGKQSSTVSAGEEMHTCSVPVGHFWYVNHMYEEELKRIEKKNGVKIKAEVKVRFEVDQKHGSPDNALDEFANLVQKSLAESSGSVIPLKFRDPDQWGDALKTLQEKENKLLVTLTSETMTVRGPTKSQEAIKKFLNADTHQKRNTDASHEQNERETQDTSLEIELATKDHLMHMGLTMEESYWKVMITSYSEKVAKIKDKFNVDLKESDIGQGKVNVKAVYKRDEGNASMESHAVRELLYLYQKTATSPMNISQSNTATEMWGWSWPWL